MSVITAQPIAGVSAGRETEIESIYPSVAGGFLGRLIGVLMGAAGSILPFTPFRQLLQLLMGTLLAPLGALAYLLTKLLGDYYVLSNRTVTRKKMIGGKVIKQVPLSDVAHISIATPPGSAFHRTGDVQLEDAAGNLLLVISAIQFPQRLRQVILDARDARIRNDESLATIRARA
ncbi:hypothetical protein [Planctomicrobium sp. SH664]|uniref:hypothetical protein n=1 Tax=Planctomicrobium sp. SH664 TaxID=3448125 RepID=UPI003F5B165E